MPISSAERSRSLGVGRNGTEGVRVAGAAEAARKQHQRNALDRRYGVIVIVTVAGGVSVASFTVY